MDKVALLVAVIAIIATFLAAKSSSVRNESHQQVNNIHALLKEISDITHRYFEGYVVTAQDTLDIDKRRANTYEAVCNMKLDLLESSLTLLVRRCTSYFFYDANSAEFLESYIDKIGAMRDKISEKAYLETFPHSSIFSIDSSLTRLYADLNQYIGDRFRPVFEKATD
ncbi:hypothetical protein [Pseudomonas kurunegalensis]|uniref:hypothetical protein n=1 Tax=Pseudomonas kurunegalensis TaxID=485880 RepID=UPI002570AE85|nr:hypothetical protein [Pseudomonas kurunegalensis]WJD61541.1 hypothetical protein QQ992_21780 [Pseudomonas kurunegalensis]